MWSGLSLSMSKEDAIALMLPIHGWDTILKSGFTTKIQRTNTSSKYLVEGLRVKKILHQDRLTVYIFMCLVDSELHCILTFWTYRVIILTCFNSKIRPIHVSRVLLRSMRFCAWMICRMQRGLEYQLKN